MELKNRSQYLDKLISVQDMEVIKVVTGIRRCGKSSLLKLMMAHLREQGVMEEQILSMNFESMQFADMDSKSLYQYVMERAPKGKRLYLFLDEVQKVRDWQDAVNSFRVDLYCDIYVTGSNAYLLSSELSTYLSGRYVEIKMLPLSFREFLDFHGYLLEEYKAPNGNVKQRARGKDGEAYELRDLFEAYAQFGGMPRWPRRSWIRSAPICCWTAFILLWSCGTFWSAANGKNSGRHRRAAASQDRSVSG